MQIGALHLAAFGPFTDTTLQFEPAVGTLHIVYGPNEAGKSAALRALTGLLYGIDERTTDNFLHPNETLRIGGRLLGRDGRVLQVVRRKGRKNTLLDSGGSVLDDAVLQPFLRGVSYDVFTSLFGIDRAALTSGGRDILEQRGEVGQALFSASLGSHALQRVLADLDAQADGLFKPRGSTPPVNRAIKRYTELGRQIKDASLSARAWDEHRRELARVNRDLEQVQKALAQARTDLSRLQRVQRILPNLAKRRDLIAQREAMGAVVVLPEDFAPRRHDAVTARQNARAIADKTAAQREQLQAAVAEIEVREAVLQHAESIQALHEQLGGIRKAAGERPHRQAERLQKLQRARDLLHEIDPRLGLEDLHELRRAYAMRTRVTELGNRHGEVAQRRKQAVQIAADLTRRLAEVRKRRQDMPAASDPGPLQRVVAAARKAGDLDGVILGRRESLARETARCDAAVAALPFWRGDQTALREAALPPKPTIDEFAERYAELARESERLRDRRTRLTNDITDADERLRALTRNGAVPREADLDAARAARNELWRLLRRHWVDGEDVTPDVDALRRSASDALQGGRSLPDAFERTVDLADELADRLRWDAERVTEDAALQATKTAAASRLRELQTEFEANRAARDALDADWRLLWAPVAITPRSPREMRAWSDEVEVLRGRLTELVGLQRQCAEAEHSRESHRAAVVRQMEALGESCLLEGSLEAVLQHAEAVVETLETRQRRRSDADHAIEQLQQELVRADADQDAARLEWEAWKADWRAATAAFGLASETSPREAHAFLDRLHALFAVDDDVQSLTARLAATDADARRFRDQVQHLVSEVAPEYAAMEPADAAAALSALLSEVEKRATRHAQLSEQLAQVQLEWADARATAKTMDERLHRLLREAGVKSLPELETAEQRSRAFRRIDEQLAVTQQTLLEAGDGMTVAALEAEARGVDADALASQIAGVRERIDEELEPRRDELAETRGRLQSAFEALNGGDTAARLAEDAEAVLADIRSGAEAYVRALLAGRILRDEIERYRTANQGPLLERASALFARLTLGSMAGLRTDFNERDEPILLGSRANGESVRVEGMSAGTRDQLYLALRLASLEKYIEDSEPMPFIVDDILVEFDDLRAEAALAVLADLSRQTQVVVFSHHGRLVEQAKSLRADVHVHSL